MNIRELLNGSHNSEDGSMDEKAGKKRDSDLPEPVEWTDGNLQKIVNALVIRGYGNWEGISKESKLNWSDYDIAHGARLALLQLLKWSCMALPANQSASTSNNTDSEPTSDTPAPQSHSQGQSQPQSQSQSSSTNTDLAADAVYEFVPDNKYLTVFLRKSRACWMAVACQNKGPVDMADQTTRIDTETECDKSVVENQLLKDALDTYESQHRSLLATAATDGVAINSECGDGNVDREALKRYYEAYDRLCCSEPSASDASTQEQRQEDSSMVVEGDQETVSLPAPTPVKRPVPALTAETVVTVLSRLELPSAFVDVPLDRVLKTRTAARAKLSQIEDLFELHLLAQLFQPTTAPAPVMLVSDDMATVEEAATDQMHTTTHVPTDSEVPGVPVVGVNNTSTATGNSIIGVSAVLSPLSLDQWTCQEDTRLIRLVDKVYEHSA